MSRRGFSAKKPNIRLFLFILIFVALSGMVVFGVYRGADLFKRRSESSSRVISIGDLWESGQYSQIVELSEKLLATSPMDADALLYAGYSRFFTAISRLSAEERNTDLDAAIRHLRLLKARGGAPYPERIDYVLGKAYLIKGRFWSDLAVRYLESSLEAGYLAEDSYEFLGRSYSALGDLDKALIWYEKAAETHPTDRLLLTLGEDAFQLGRYNDAAAYYLRAIEVTRDESLKKRGLSQLGQLYYDVGNYTKAKDVLDRLVELEPGNADYQFLLGETCFSLGRIDDARRAWFRVTRIDPRHVGALRRLYD